MPMLCGAVGYSVHAHVLASESCVLVGTVDKHVTCSPVSRFMAVGVLRVKVDSARMTTLEHVTTVRFAFISWGP